MPSSARHRAERTPKVSKEPRQEQESRKKPRPERKPEPKQRQDQEPEQEPQEARPRDWRVGAVLIFFILAVAAAGSWAVQSLTGLLW